MNVVTLLQPPCIVFGNGCAAKCADLIAERGLKRVLLVSTKSVLPQLEPLLKALAEAGCRVIQTGRVSPEPTCALFEEVLREARSAQADSVLGIGGGSALDVAKLVAALAGGTQSLADVFGIGLLQGRKLFLVCLPTTAGTGSEVSPNAVLLDEKDELKKAVISPYLVPDAAFIDPLLTVSAPPAVTAATGLDALTHCIEAYANQAAHPLVDMCALEGIRLISAHLLGAVSEGSDVAARAHLALGSLYGGLCLGPVNTAAVHALAYPLGSRFHVAHGVSIAVLLPHVLRFNLPSAARRYARIARALGLEPERDDLRAGSPSPAEPASRHAPVGVAPGAAKEQWAELTGQGDKSTGEVVVSDFGDCAGSALELAGRGVERLAQLSRACSVPQRLCDLGVGPDDIPWMAKAAMKVTRLLKNNPRQITEEDATRIYEAAY